MCGVLGAWIVAARLCKPDQRAGIMEQILKERSED